MIEIKDLISELEDILLKEESKILVLSNIINKITGIKINPKDIKVKNHAIYLNIKPLYRNEIFLKKDRILLELEKNLIRKIPKTLK